MSVGNFAILALMDSIQATTTLWLMTVSGNQVCFGPEWNLIGSQSKC